MIRRRTTCVYCGRRIAGRLNRKHPGSSFGERELYRLCARLACDRHLRLPLSDPNSPIYWLSTVSTGLRTA